MALKRGDVCLVDFGNQGGNLQTGLRPAVVVQNDIGNYYSPVTMVCPLTKQLNKAPMPTHVIVERGNGGIRENSLILTEQVRSVNKYQIRQIIGSLAVDSMRMVDTALKIALGVCG